MTAADKIRLDSLQLDFYIIFIIWNWLQFAPAAHGK